ncbi:MAG TPA: hypothetical protein VNK95_06480 [Caldilineaceae bacterium]|nr:hypothetical protein [Caldilineaceae bacterium]
MTMRKQSSASNAPPEQTRIFRRTVSGDFPIGYIGADGRIFRLRWDEGIPIGRVDAGRVYRATQHDERELGAFTPDGRVHSHGLFEGGPIGWVDQEGVVIQGGLIFGEEEVGRVEGPQRAAAAAALLLLFLPDEQEADKRARRD